MPVSPARAAAFEILLRVKRENSYASELLHSTRFAKLSSADHGLATELVMGVLRWQSLLDHGVAVASAQKLSKLDDEVLIALRLGLYQLQFLSRIPARAAIFESVELVKKARKGSAATFVNAVLRKVAGEAERRRTGAHFAEDAFAEIENSSDAITLAQNSAHPEWLVRRWIARYGLVAARQLCAYDQHAPLTSIRVWDKQSAEELVREGIKLAPGQLLSTARTVVSGDITRTRAFREGRVGIQDEGSQLVALLAGRGENILDCCAAPGGKTALLARRNPAAMVIASELHPHRARLLRELVGLSNVRVVAADAGRLPFSRMFDCILADVPCSGTGTLARNPEIKWRLRVEDLDDLQSRQIAILRSALAWLTPGGRFIYSTCSMECEENEAVVEAVLREAPELSVINCHGELEELKRAGELCVNEIETLLDGPHLRTIPGVHRCDGFFAAIIQRAHKAEPGKVQLGPKTLPTDQN